MSIEKFAKALKETLNKENILTENGAVGYRTSGNPLVDFNFHISSFRNENEMEIVNEFAEAFAFQPVYAVKMLFFAGDIRQGMGERKVFNSCLQWLAKFHSDYCDAVVPLIVEYTRWDYLVALLGTKCDKRAWQVIKEQLDKDIERKAQDKPISLLAKWLPSVNTSSKATNALGKTIASRLGMKECGYRKMLSGLRGHIDVVERKMSSNNWQEIDYNAVPSKANLKYKDAFLRHDNERRRQYLNALEHNDGTAKINSSVAFPYEIVSSYFNGQWCVPDAADSALEAMWCALPDYVSDKNSGGTICIVDGSGSMGDTIGNTSVTAHDVARSLGIYFSERLTGAFKDKFITFSCNPQLVDLSNCKTLLEKIHVCVRHDECENTDIEKAFDLILTTAIKGKLRQADLPKTILVISDMEFDGAVYFNSYSRGEFMSGFKTLFETIGERFNAHGYTMPRLVFWNVNSRTKAIPLRENEAGVALVSGFSPTIASMVFSGKLNPETVLFERLDSERYKPIGDAIANVG